MHGSKIVPDEPAPVLEHGELFFFYRPRVDVEVVGGLADVQRFLMIMAPVPGPLYRLFVIGRKKLPVVHPGPADPEERRWALNVLTTTRADDLRPELDARRYLTRTRGERFLGAAQPVGQGRYELLRHGDHTELAYVLELPRPAGPAQDAFEIRDQASYVVAVKNPDVTWPGLPTSAEAPPYPPDLRAKFAGRRWIDADDPRLLDYVHTQILLVGAHRRVVEVDAELAAAAALDQNL